MEIINLRYGFIKFNTTFIPIFLHKEKLTDGKNANSSIYIKSKIPQIIKFDSIEYTLDCGEHFIPNVHSFHKFIILTDLTNNEECEVYHNCVVDNNYFIALPLLYSSNLIAVNTIHPKNNNKYTIFNYGMASCITYEELYYDELNENNIDKYFTPFLI